MAISEQDNNVALFVDAENLIRPLEQKLERADIESIVRRVREYGVLTLSRAYGDWGFFPCRDYIRDVSNLGIEMAQLHSDIKGKNTADMQLTVDALEHCRSQYAANIFALVSGDRDFVPLVQSLRRQGKYVICICVEETASQVMKRVSDVFIAYENLHRKGPAVEAPPAEKPPTGTEPEEVVPEVDERRHAFQTLVDAIVAINRRGQPSIGGHANQVMQQLQPDFDLISLGYNSFKEFVEEAEREGFVKVTPPPSGLGDFQLDLVKSESPPPAVDTRPRLDYDTDEDAYNSYRQILERKRVPIIAWKFREPLVRHVWELLEKHGESGILGDEMVTVLLRYAVNQGWHITEEQAFKLVYSLNLGYCFKVAGIAQRSSDILNSFVSAAVDDDQALEMINILYLRGLSFEDNTVKFRPKAVARLLFDSDDDKAVKDGQQLIYAMYA